MSRFSDLVSTPAREMAAHFPAPSPRKDSGETQPPLIKLDSNENPFGPSPLAINAMQSALAGAHTSIPTTTAQNCAASWRAITPC
jgi:histidinol-phosphate/aromatic aminotransferase/cobyric acid decarboxylase-like protein